MLVPVLLALHVQTPVKRALGNDFEYSIDGKSFQGYLAKPKVANPKAMVFVIQDWNGVDTHETFVCEKLAIQGFEAMAIDIYGKGIRPRTVETCSAESGKYYADPDLYMKRITRAIAAYERSKSFSKHENKIAIGYCFGGSGVLELARRNLGFAGVVSFHGGLKPLAEPKANKYTAEVIIEHGLADPFIEKDDVAGAKEEFAKKAKSFQFDGYASAVHAFTVKSMGFKVDGAAYDEKAANQSWSMLMKYLGKYKR